MPDQLHPVRSWYGLSGEISVEDQLWHLVKVGGVPLPHPPLINLILRAGLPRSAWHRLSFLHEFGHLQTFPFALIQAALLILLRYEREGQLGISLKQIGMWLIAHQAAWELASELYALGKSGAEYRQIYRKHPNSFGQVLFWGGMSSLAVLSSLRFIRGDN